MEQATGKTMKEQKAFLLVGSPKGTKGSSYSMGSYLIRKLAAGGVATDSMSVGQALHSEENTSRMLDAVNAANLVVVAFPLYVDQLPAPLVKAAELIAEWRRRSDGRTVDTRESQSPDPAPHTQKLMAIVNCGFPEVDQIQPAVDIMRKFAAETGFHWAGALALSMGGAVSGMPLEKAGGRVRNVVKALDLAAASLIAGGGVPPEAASLMAKPFIPKWLYCAFANIGWRQQARKHGVRKQMYSRPYEP